MLIKFVLMMLVGAVTQAAVKGNPCCSFPCQNGGICMTKGTTGDFVCDCTNLDYYGKYCETPYLWKRITSFFKPSAETEHYLLVNFGWFWSIINNLDFLRQKLMQVTVLDRENKVDSPVRWTSGYEYITTESHFNHSYYARILPPVPKDCPTPLGVVGKKELPAIKEVAEKLFRRRKFIPSPIKSSLLFPYFAQHFSHIFFKTDFEKGPGFSWGNRAIDVSSVYGVDIKRQDALRSHKDGKLKMQIIDDEEWPVTVKEAPVQMPYPEKVPEKYRYALGHPFYALLPGLFAYSTVWMREHNRVCDILKKEHPEYDDERLFQTAKLIILGELIKIVTEDYVQHISNYNFKLLFRPEIVHWQIHRYTYATPMEFAHMYHWHPLMPESFNISGTDYAIKDYMYHSELVVKHGMKNFVDALSRQIAGKIGPRNHGPSTLHIAEMLIREGRELRLQPFNEYRKYFDLKPYTSFEELTGEKELAAELEKLYGSVDAVEYYAGLLLEKRALKAMTGLTVVALGGALSVFGLYSNPICSEKWWKPSTFGGEIGMEIINTATIQKLFCQNIKGDCPLVSFVVPEENLPADYHKDEL